ncbi:SAF domain-containing protein [Nakamurella endophytica]|uniref:SAF domain-containing protein n=1 Tax=Nakamurella endophytica TaxID=1748367 RepID=UPI001668B378|nr:SAF domain-containing protein [Nakamurella endophytica]
MVAAVVIGARVVGAAARTTAVLAAAHDLAPGTVLVSADLVPVDVRLGESLPLYLAAGDGTAAVGRTVEQPVRAGQLVPAAALAAPASGRVVVIGVPADAMPPGVAHGSTIDLYLTTGNRQTTGSTKTDRVASGITVQSVTAPASGGLSGAGSNRYQIAVLLDAAAADQLVRMLPQGDPVVVLRSGA